MRVLIIDDDPILLTMISEMLSTSGIDVFTASNGVDGVAATQEHAPDVVILDLMMPEVSGWDVCKAIRKFSDVPILILSAVTDSNRVMESLDAGADDYLVKPVPKGVLISHINRLARMKK